MTTQLQQAASICLDLHSLLNISSVIPAMTVENAATLGYELNGRHVIAICMSWNWQEAGRVVSVACPISRKVLNKSKRDYNMRYEIIRACVGVWRERLHDEWVDYGKG